MKGAMNTDLFDLSYIEERPPESQYEDAFRELLGGDTWKGVRDALSQHAAENDHTLTLSEICRAMNRAPNNAPYGFFASHLVKLLPIPVKKVLVSEGAKKHRRTYPVLSKGYVTYAIAACSTSKDGETQWTLYPEVVMALRRAGLVITVGQLKGQRVPLWALERLEPKPATPNRKPVKEPKHMTLGERWDSTGLKGWGVLDDEQFDE